MIDYNEVEPDNFKDFAKEVAEGCGNPKRECLIIIDETGDKTVNYECYGIRTICKTGCQCSCGMELLIRKKEGG